jgi:phasin family protein
MSALPEQFSEAHRLQLDTQFNLISTFAGKAFESVEKIIALNMDASRASMEKSSALMRQMMAVKDPRDLIALTNQTQSQFDSALAYGRQLLGIATDVATTPAAAAAFMPASVAPSAALLAKVPRAAPAPVASKAAPAAPVASKAAPAAPAVSKAAPAAPVVTKAVPAAPVASKVAPASVAQAPKVLAASAPVADLAPIAEPNPIAKAVGAQGSLLTPSAASFPVPSSTKPIAVASVKPVEAAPPHAPVSVKPAVVAKQAAAPAVVSKPAAAPAAKPARKK